MLHPPDCPTWFPLHSHSRLCLRLASMLCPFHFVLHDSGRTDLPRFPCLLPTSCDRGTHMQLTDCYLLDCSTCTGCIPCRWASTQLHDILLTRKRLTKSFAQALFCLFRLLVLSPMGDRLERVHHEQIREPHIALNVCHPASSSVLCRQIMMHKPAVPFGDADYHVLKLGFAHL
jgi:hypothetical protein